MASAEPDWSAEFRQRDLICFAHATREDKGESRGITMNRFKRSPLIAARGVLLRSAAFAAAMGSAASAWSQTPPVQADASPIETVTISAQKRGVLEDAQVVPIALTAINGVEIE